MILARVMKAPSMGVSILNFGPCAMQASPLTSRATRGEPLKLQKPFPYKEKTFSWWNALTDNTMLRVSAENAKILVVEGSIAVGKSAFAKAVAEEFDMHYMPQPTMDELYVFPSGYDTREVDHLIPEEARTYDHKNFCMEPKTWKAAWFQYYMLYLRFYQYFDALCHLYNTGQGVVLERSYYSDPVFMHAMYKSGFVSKQLRDAYFTIKKNTSTFFQPPHVIIYLDVPVPVVQERIRTRNYSWEQNSPALTPEYLRNIERYYKEYYLKNAKKNSEILIYDWSNGGDIDVVIDDIEKLDLDVMRRDWKFVEWWLSRDYLYHNRQKLTNRRRDYDQYFFHPWYKVDDLKVTPQHIKAMDEVLCNNPETKYDKGYNYLMGDKIFNILFKANTEDHRAPKYHLNIIKHWDY